MHQGSNSLQGQTTGSSSSKGVFWCPYQLSVPFSFLLKEYHELFPQGKMAENTAGHSPLSMPRQRPVKLYPHSSWHRDNFLLWEMIFSIRVFFGLMFWMIILCFLAKILQACWVFPIWVHWNLFYLFTLTFTEQKSIKHEVQHPPLHPMSSQLGPGISYVFLTHSYM